MSKIKPMRTSFKYSLLLTVILFCTKCELNFGDATWETKDETIHCNGGFVWGDTTGCIFVDLEPNLVIDMPNQAGSNLDSISILDNGIYDVIFRCQNSGSWLNYWIILKDGIEAAGALINPPKSGDWESAFFGFNYSFCVDYHCTYNIAYGDELCAERYKWNGDTITYLGSGDAIYKQYYIPIKQKTNEEVLIGWIKMSKGESIDTSNYFNSWFIEEYAIQKPKK